MFLYQPEATSGDLGEAAVIRCSAFSVPAPTYAWMHDGMFVKEDDEGRVRVINGSLFFSELRREDAGTYECAVEIPMAQIVSSPVELVVYGETVCLDILLSLTNSFDPTATCMYM